MCVQGLDFATLLLLLCIKTLTQAHTLSLTLDS